jgi:hypothetical protein
LPLFKQPSSPRLFRVNKAYLNNLVGFELWEILTMLTVVLSLASGIMWYSNFQPKHAARELAIIEKQKHIIFNQFIATQLNLETKYATLKTSKDCLKQDTENQLNTLDLDEELGKLKTFAQSSSSLKEEPNSLTKFDPTQNSLPELLGSYDIYLNVVQGLRQDQYEFKKNLYESREIFKTICKLGYAKDQDQIAELEIISNNLQRQQSYNQVALQAIVKDFLQNYSNVSDQSQAVIPNLKDLYDKLFELNYDQKPISKTISDKSEQFVEVLKKVENQEREIIQKNPDLKYKVVYVY